VGYASKKDILDNYVEECNNTMVSQGGRDSHGKCPFLRASFKFLTIFVQRKRKLALVNDLQCRLRRDHYEETIIGRSPPSWPPRPQASKRELFTRSVNLYCRAIDSGAGKCS